ncbi:MAG: lipid A deacylase LpxR family protein [Pseudomarimonas sp.]
MDGLLHHGAPGVRHVLTGPRVAPLPAQPKRLRMPWRVLLALCVVGSVAPAGAQEAVTFTFENDVLTGSDNSYSNGFGASWVSADLDTYDADSAVRRWGRLLDFLPFIGDDGYRTYASWSLVQEIHTPNDIKLVDPPHDDQPYAGLLHVDSVLYARSERWSHAWELKLGAVGEASRAEQVQRGVHRLIGADEPMGWDTQLPDEPVFNVGLTSAYLWKQGTVGESAQWRLIPVGHLGLGTYFTGAGLGMYGEVGWNLVQAFGGNSLREGLSAASAVGVGPVDGWSVSYFGGFSGHAVAHYLPLDGTVFRDSRSVDSKPLVGSATVGASLRRGRLALSLAATHSTHAFEGQQQGAEFGTLSVTWLL